jgi:hypothetical protein
MKRVLIAVFAILIILICMGLALNRPDPKVPLNGYYKVQETPTATPTPTPLPSPAPSRTATPVPEPEPVPTPTVTP